MRRAFGATAWLALAAGLVWAESSYQSSPGVLSAVALAIVLGVAALG